MATTPSVFPNNENLDAETPLARFKVPTSIYEQSRIDSAVRSLNAKSLPFVITGAQPLRKTDGDILIIIRIETAIEAGRISDMAVSMFKEQLGDERVEVKANIV